MSVLEENPALYPWEFLCGSKFKSPWKGPHPLLFIHSLVDKHLHIFPDLNQNIPDRCPLLLRHRHRHVRHGPCSSCLSVFQISPKPSSSSIFDIGPNKACFDQMFYLILFQTQTCGCVDQRLSLTFLFLWICEPSRTNSSTAVAMTTLMVTSQKLLVRNVLGSFLLFSLSSCKLYLHQTVAG